MKTLREVFGELNYRFAYPEIESTLNLSGVKKETLLRTLRAVIGTLDPTLTDVSESKDLRDSFIIRRKGQKLSFRTVNCSIGMFCQAEPQRVSILRSS